MVDVLLFTDTIFLGWARSTGPYRVASALREAGFSVQVVEFFSHYSPDELRKIVDRFVSDKTLFVGFSTTHTRPMEQIDDDETYFHRKFAIGEYSQCYVIFKPEGTSPFCHSLGVMEDLFAHVRKRNPACRIVAGGGQAFKGIYNGNGWGVDLFVLGDADVSAVAIAHHLRDSSNPLKTSARFGARFVDSEVDYPVNDYTRIRTFLDPTDHVWSHEPLPMETARGCIFRCGFCSHTTRNGKKIGTWERDSEGLRDEFIRNYELFGTTRYVFTDSTINPTRERMEQLHRVMTSLHFRIEWMSYARAEHYARWPETLQMAKEMGVISHHFGLESLTQSARRAVGKPMRPEDIIETYHRIRGVMGPEFRISVSVIAGLPGETLKDLEKTFEWLLSRDCPVDHWFVNQLYLRRQDPDVYMPTSDSPFALDPAKYGYRFPTSDPNYWENDVTNFVEVSKFVNQFRRHSLSKTKLSFYDLMALIGLGYDRKELITWTMDDLYARRKQFPKDLARMKQEYYSKLVGGES